MKKLTSGKSLMPHGITCKENLLKECEEEAGIPRLICILSNCTPLVQFVLNIHGYLLQLGCIAESYPSCLTELKLPDGFIPKNQDGEVASFKLIPVMHVANIIRRCGCCRAQGMEIAPKCCVVKALTKLMACVLLGLKVKRV
ncbi:hypothetical protein HHK36_033484 [Tetracentron sinense]|uniref:Nudix hydrolase domain-containing protein n=1 Tax=Tetracentron sinense TaxID=13715 RepID=A0A835CWM5_TETSI|nr:hypothetical protein HHK36_033484 [Tetracentron sinense]